MVRWAHVPLCVRNLVPIKIMAYLRDFILGNAWDVKGHDSHSSGPQLWAVPANQLIQIMSRSKPFVAIESVNISFYVELDRVWCEYLFRTLTILDC